MSQADFLFVGTSPNALAGAARLARAGARVVMLETRAAVGGPVATEEFAPGFRADTGVMSASLDAEVAQELGVAVETIRRDTVTRLGASPVTLRENDFAVAAPGKLPRAFFDAVELLRAIHRIEPPDVPDTGSGALAELGSRLKALGPREMHEVLRLLFLPARDFCDENFADEAVRAVFAGAALRALGEGPFAPGTLFGLLHHAALDDGPFRSTARGGVGALALALADVARASGVEIRTSFAGPVPRQGHVISDRDARATFTGIVSPAELDPEFNRAVRAIRYRGSVARVHCALSGLPSFAGVDAAALAGTLVVAPSVASLERAWDQAKRGVLPDHPYIEAVLPTVRDPGLAPEGRHVLDAWVQWVPRGADRGTVLQRVLAELGAFAPDLPGLVQHHHVSLPEDLEHRFGLTEGHLYGGEVRLDQAFFLRPLGECARYDTPLGNLHLCGSATHPGGYSGRSGWNLAGRLLRTTTGWGKGA